jgi:GT2 family glycosyltransferase
MSLREECENLVSVVVPSYRDSVRVSMLVRELADQRLPDGWSLEVIVVDDGSGEPHVGDLSRLAGCAFVVLLPENVGRSSAVAAGIDSARGELLLVTNSDCLPEGRDFLGQHVKAMSDSEVVASNGPVCGHDGSFWSRYQNRTMAQRARTMSALPGMVGSTANSCIRRRAYLKVGGLDRGYSGYGFEDRDLLLRLAAVGRMAWTPGAVIKHMDALSLRSVCKKIGEAGRGNSRLFAERHPIPYRLLGYSRFDARGRPLVARVGRAIAPMVLPAASALDRVLEHLPFMLSSFLVKALSAVAFFAGTSLVENSPES